MTRRESVTSRWCLLATVSRVEANSQGEAAGRAHSTRDGVEVPQLRGYEVTVVGQATEDRDLLEPPDELTPGVRIEVEEGRVLLHMRLTSPDGATALRVARETADDFFRVLASSYAAYRLDPFDQRDHITRADAVYVAEGPIPDPDVAEGYISEEGLDFFDPGGAARRAGKVLRLRARARAAHQIADDARRFNSRGEWSPRLRAALTLYWAGQCSPDREVRFVLAMAALEVLAAPSDQTLLGARLDPQGLRQVRRGVSAVLRDAGLTPPDVDRLLGRLMETHEIGATTALTTYLNAQVTGREGSLAERVNAAEVRAWQGERGSYLHAGLLDKTEEASRDRLRVLVGQALRNELDRLVA